MSTAAPEHSIHTCISRHTPQAPTLAPQALCSHPSRYPLLPLHLSSTDHPRPMCSPPATCTLGHSVEHVRLQEAGYADSRPELLASAERGLVEASKGLALLAGGLSGLPSELPPPRSSRLLLQL